MFEATFLPSMAKPPSLMFEPKTELCRKAPLTLASLASQAVALLEASEASVEDVTGLASWSGWTECRLELLRRIVTCFLGLGATILLCLFGEISALTDDTFLFSAVDSSRHDDYVEVQRWQHFSKIHLPKNPLGAKAMLLLCLRGVASLLWISKWRDWTDDSLTSKADKERHFSCVTNERENTNVMNENELF